MTPVDPDPLDSFARPLRWYEVAFLAATFAAFYGGLGLLGWWVWGAAFGR